MPSGDTSRSTAFRNGGLPVCRAGPASDFVESALVAVWHDPRTPARDRKRMLRLLIENVTLFAGGAARPARSSAHCPRGAGPAAANGSNSMNTRAWPDQFRVQSWAGFYETTWADHGQYGDLHASRLVRTLAGPATLISIDELVLVAQNVRAGAAAASVVAFPRSWSRRTPGRGLGSLSRFGGGVDQSVVAALVASGTRRAGSTERDVVTGTAATTIPPERGWTAHRRRYSGRSGSGPVQKSHPRPLRRVSDRVSNLGRRRAPNPP